MPKSSSSRWLAGIVTAVAVLAVASVAVTLLSADTVEQLPEGSPERAVQQYLLAVQERDFPAAYALLSPEVHEHCTLQDFEHSSRFQDGSNIRVRLDNVRMTSTGAEVSVRITETFSAQPIPSEYTRTDRYFLVEVDGSWRLRDVGWPGYGCYPEWRFPAHPPTPTPPPPADGEEPETEA